MALNERKIVFCFGTDTHAVNIDSFLDLSDSFLVYNVTYTMSNDAIHHGMLLLTVMLGM